MGLCIAKKVDQFKKAVEETDFFDSNLWWDPFARECFVRYTDWKEWREDYHGFGLRRGLVTSAEAARYDARSGNEKLAELLQGEDTLYGCMVLTPDMFFGEGGGTYIDSLTARKFVAARLFPQNYMHSVKEYEAGALLDALEERDIPLLLWHTQTSFEEIDQICARRPQLRLVVEGHDRKLLYHAKQYTALFLKHKNFFLETHNIILFHEFETLNEMVGCDRLLYGSYYPYCTPHYSLYQVLMADIEDDAKQNICSKNAERLFQLGRGKGCY